MRYVASREEMQQIDAYSINTMGIPGIVLMEKAALALEEVFLERVSTKSHVLIVTEKGNNGGDGLALGRLLLEDGYNVDFYEIGAIPHDSDSHQIQKKVLEQMEAQFLMEFPEEEYDVIVDAVFGVGLKREVAGQHREVIERMNQKKALKVAVDVPSGVDASTGQILGIAFCADLTVTFGLLKAGLLLYPGADISGEVIVKEIGFPNKAVEKIAPKMISFVKEDLALLPERKAWTNKGNYGKVLLIAGAKNMAGAAVLSGTAAYKSGSGLVRIFSCEENRVILQEKLPEAILTTYDSEKKAGEILPEAISWASVIGIGPGIGQSIFARRLLKQVLALGKVPLVIDADGLNNLAVLLKNDEMKKVDGVTLANDTLVFLKTNFRKVFFLVSETAEELSVLDALKYFKAPKEEQSAERIEQHHKHINMALRKFRMMQDEEARSQETTHEEQGSVGVQVSTAVNLLNNFIREIDDNELYIKVVQLKTLAERGVITYIAKRLQRIQKNLRRVGGKARMTHDEALAEIIDMAKKYAPYYTAQESLLNEQETNAEIILSESFNKL